MYLRTSTQQWQDFDDQQRFAHLEALYDFFILDVELWAKNIGLAPAQIVFDQAIYEDVIEHYYKDLDRMSRNIRSSDGQPAIPDDYKQKAIYAFWLRKLKPLSLKEEIKDIDGLPAYWLNEIVAIYIILIELDIIYKKNNRKIGAVGGMPYDLYYDLICFFRYKSVSPHALYLILASLYK